MQALKYIVHLVADVHQPLHATVDVGDKRVRLGNKVYSLHKIWDTISLQTLRLPPKAIAQKLDRRAQSNPPQVGGSPEDWTIESRDIARDHIFPLLWSATKDEDGDFVLPRPYLKDNRQIVYDRLTQAAFRLADLLNATLGERDRLTAFEEVEEVMMTGSGDGHSFRDRGDGYLSAFDALVRLREGVSW